ncbi:DUF1638 domain-containing protein [Litorimonas sp. RW-G-Af-16]|uniref:DUF1638 domain-containing protein n=1 Tax=Litorimonas sp. RW-G-Af-16 TaxID=3241168 RepID=UPI00390C6A74
METAAHKTLVLACGALAKEIVRLQTLRGAIFDLQCLPAGYHNTPDKIVPELRKLLDARAGDYDRVIIGYGDCGTGGGLDRLLADYPKAERLPGAHCYAFYAGLPEFDAMMEEELGSFFLTDYLVRHFETLIIKGMGLDRFPNLRDDYFKHYKRLVYISQAPDADLVKQAEAAAVRLGLAFEQRDVGYGALQGMVRSIPQKEAAHV